jgi:hypothetical protein
MTTVTVYNNLGAVIMTRYFTAKQYEMNVSGLSRGIYFVKIKDGKDSVTLKMIKK